MTILAAVVSIVLGTILLGITFVVCRLLGVKVESWIDLWGSMLEGIMGIFISSILLGFYGWLGYEAFKIVRDWWFG